MAAAMLLYSFYHPWWICEFSEIMKIKIYSWGLRHALAGQYATYIAKDVTPMYQTITAWIYASFCAGLLLFSIFINKYRLAFVIQVIIGVSYAAYALDSYVYSD
jgi:hypothetical protein